MSEQSTQLAVRTPPPPMSALELRTQVQQIQQVMEAVMKAGEHYGTIPGCGNKPTLLQPGAQKLALTFGLASAYTITRVDLPAGHREYEVRCQLTHRPTGNHVGEGVGCATTMESKHRYRSSRAADTPTGVEVPRTFWDRKKAGAAGAELRKILADAVGQPGTYGTQKDDALGKWLIIKRGDRIDGAREENPDIADTYNTVLKMAKKRAFVDAVITATAAGDIFTQDLEDLPNSSAPPPAPPPSQPPSTTPPQSYTRQRPPQASPPATPAASGQHQARPAAQAAAPAKPKPSGGPVAIKSVDIVKSGIGSNNKPYTIYGIVDANGVEYKTFSQTHADIAATARDSGHLVSIRFTSNKYGNNIEALEPANPQDIPPAVGELELPTFPPQAQHPAGADNQPPFEPGAIETEDADVYDGIPI